MGNIQNLNKMGKRKHRNLSILALLITGFIITLLILTGPAYALSLNLQSDKTDVKKGDNINFDVTINLDSSQYQDLSSITLVLDGPLRKECVFDKTGGIINGCSGVSSVTLLSKTSGVYGYGYGYGYGGNFNEVKYRVKLNTGSYPAGTYNTQIKTLIGNSLYTKNGNPITIRSSSNSGGDSTVDTRETGSTNPFSNGRSDDSTNKVYLQENDMFNFVMGYEKHSLEVISITNESVNLVIRSEPKQVMMTITEDKMVDVNDDGVDDLKLSLLYTGDEKASLEIKYPESLELNKNISSTSNTGNKVDGFLESNYAEYEPVAEAKNLFFSNGIFGSFIFILILAFINLIMLELIAFTILSAKRKRSKVKIRRYL